MNPQDLLVGNKAKKTDVKKVRDALIAQLATIDRERKRYRFPKRSTIYLRDLAEEADMPWQRAKALIEKRGHEIIPGYLVEYEKAESYTPTGLKRGDGAYGMSGGHMPAMVTVKAKPKLKATKAKKQPKLTKTEQQILKDLRESPEGRMVYEAGTFRTGGRHSKVKHRGGRTAVAIDKLVTKGLVTATQRTYNEDGNIWTEYRVTLKGDA